MKMGALSKVALVSAVAVLGWAYQATRPPPSPILGAPGGPPVTSRRVQLRDGRHLAYMEAGVHKEKARYKVVFIHGFASTKESGFPVSQVTKPRSIVISELKSGGVLCAHALACSFVVESRSTSQVTDKARAYLLACLLVVTIAGARGGAGDIHAVLRQSRVRRQRRQPKEVPEERRHGRGGARRRATARGQVPRGCLLHGRIRRVELPQLHSAQACRSGSGRAGGELLVAAAGRRAEERTREAGRPGPEDVLDRAPRAVAAPRLARAEVAPGVADHQGRAHRVHRQGLGDPHRALDEAARERPAGGSGESDAAGDLRVPVPGRDDPVRHVGVRPHGDEEPVPRRRGRRQHLAGVRGQDRAGGDPAARGAEAAVGAVPRAPRGRARAAEHGRSRGRDRQGALGCR